MVKMFNSLFYFYILFYLAYFIITAGLVVITTFYALSSINQGKEFYTFHEKTNKPNFITPLTLTLVSGFFYFSGAVRHFTALGDNPHTLETLFALCLVGTFIFISGVQTNRLKTPREYSIAMGILWYIPSTVYIIAMICQFIGA